MSEKLQAGLQVQREMFGRDFADGAMESASEFMKPFQELMTEYCFGEIWTRPGLERKIRSLVVLATLTALNRSPEIPMHVRGALANGASREEIREVLMQSMIYAGVPLSVGAFRAADEALRALDAE